MTQLLNKPLKAFITLTCVVLACSIPAYFYLVESIWISELDDHNQHLKMQIQTRFNDPDPEALREKIALWNQVQPGSHISPASGIRNDSVYFAERMIRENGGMEMERFRGLRSFVTLNGQAYTVALETNVEEVHETVLAISVITCLFIALLIAGFILLNRRLSKRIWKPFTDTLEKLKHFDLDSAGTLTFEKTGIREFAELNEALSKLIANNIRVYKQQKEFTQNASHELQTPLALLKTKLDLLIQDDSLSTEQRRIIESLDNSISRVTRINKNLLLLAGIEDKPYETSEVDLSALVRSLAQQFTEFAGSKGCTISIRVQEGIQTKANESLAEILVSNLLSNTIRHGVAGSEISVSLNKHELIVSNKGKAPLNASQLFRRFMSAGAHHPGTGLGLAIVKEIADKYGWRVSYTFTGDQHIFSVFF